MSNALHGASFYDTCLSAAKCKWPEETAAIYLQGL